MQQNSPLENLAKAVEKQRPPEQGITPGKLFGWLILASIATAFAAGAVWVVVEIIRHIP